MFVNILLIILWFVIAPVLVGRLVTVKGKEAGLKFFTVMPQGYMVLFAIFQILGLPMLFLKMELHVLTITWEIVIIILSILSLFFNPIPLRTIMKNIKLSIKSHPWVFVELACILIVSQVLLLSYFTHIDDDDAFYVGAAVTAVDTDTIFEYNAYTGSELSSLPSRYVLSPFPIYLAVLSNLTDLPPATVAHTVMPAIFILLAYIIYINIGEVIFERDRNAICIFLIVISLLNIFGNFSVYSTSSFLLFRIWQGKAVLASIILPFLLYQMMIIIKDTKIMMSWFIMFLAMIAASLVSSMGIMLAPVMFGIMAFVSAVYNKKFMILVKACLCVIPSLILGVIYITMK